MTLASHIYRNPYIYLVHFTMHRNNWSREETILALNLYLMISFGQIHRIIHVSLNSQKLFSEGIFGLALVSEDAYGNNGFDEWLMRFHGKEITKPIRPQYKQQEDFVLRNSREVFKGEGRSRA